MTIFSRSEIARTLTAALFAAVFAATCLAGATGPARAATTVVALR